MRKAQSSGVRVASVRRENPASWTSCGRGTPDAPAGVLEAPEGLPKDASRLARVRHPSAAPPLRLIGCALDASAPLIARRARALDRRTMRTAPLARSR